MLKSGDLIFQRRPPGGVCIFLGVVTADTTKLNPPVWTEHDNPVYFILHPDEGLIEDPSYYYTTIDEQEAFERAHLRWRLRESGECVPDWLENQIVKDIESGFSYGVND
jgi:hypothetical protein